MWKIRPSRTSISSREPSTPVSPVKTSRNFDVFPHIQSSEISLSRISRNPESPSNSRGSIRVPSPGKPHSDASARTTSETVSPGEISARLATGDGTDYTPGFYLPPSGTEENSQTVQVHIHQQCAMVNGPFRNLTKSTAAHLEYIFPETLKFTNLQIEAIVHFHPDTDSLQSPDYTFEITLFRRNRTPGDNGKIQIPRTVEYCSSAGNPSSYFHRTPPDKTCTTFFPRILKPADYHRRIILIYEKNIPFHFHFLQQKFLQGQIQHRINAERKNYFRYI
jgi:hypothetical protein